MNKNNYLTIVDFGSSNLRIGVFNENSKNIFSNAKEVNEKDDYSEHSNTINLLIRDAENKISTHLKNVIVLYDNSEIYSIDISLKKEFDQFVFVKDIYNSLILEANQLVSNNYINEKIIHLVVTKNIINDKKYENFDNELKTNSIIIEIKFLCLNKNKYNKVVEIFKNNNLQILNFYCSSYVKSFTYINSFRKNNYVTFLDIGWERSTMISYKKKKLICFNSIPIGGNHITKDISKVLKLETEDSEKIKKTFNKSEIEFSFNQFSEDENKNLIQQILGKNISVDLLKKVVLARIEEIIALVFEDVQFSSDYNNDNTDSVLILTGKGSNLFDKNLFHLDIKFNFTEISFYEETDLEICNAGFNFDTNSNSKINIINKNLKKYGFFEKFFNFFSK